MLLPDLIRLLGVIAAQFRAQQIPAWIAGYGAFIRLFGIFCRHRIAVGLTKAKQPGAIFNRLRRDPTQPATALAQTGHFFVNGAHLVAKFHCLSHWYGIAGHQRFEHPHAFGQMRDIALQQPFLTHNDIHAFFAGIKRRQQPRIHLARGDFHRKIKTF